MILRFVPLIGPFIAAAFPLMLSVAVDPGWTMLAWTAALFIVVELIIENLAEPWLYGSSTGLSTVAILVAATFWTWLWGAVGLVLSIPLTACIVVLGRHVPQLQFLDVLLGNRPVLTLAESFYQRMLAGDPSEVTEQAEVYLKARPLSAYYDEVVIPGLALAQSDVKRGTLDSAQRSQIQLAMEEVIEDLSEYEDVLPPTEKAKPIRTPDPRRRGPHYCRSHFALKRSIYRLSGGMPPFSVLPAAPSLMRRRPAFSHSFCSSTESARGCYLGNPYQAETWRCLMLRACRCCAFLALIRGYQRTCDILLDDCVASFRVPRCSSAFGL
jgi:hypothetical protein